MKTGSSAGAASISRAAPEEQLPAGVGDFGGGSTQCIAPCNIVPMQPLQLMHLDKLWTGR